MQQLRCLRCGESFLLTLPELVDETWRAACSHCGAVHLLKPGFQIVSLLPEKKSKTRTRSGRGPGTTR